MKTKFSICAFFKQNMSRSCEVLEQKGGASAADGLSSINPYYDGTSENKSTFGVVLLI